VKKIIHDLRGRIIQNCAVRAVRAVGGPSGPRARPKRPARSARGARARARARRARRSAHARAAHTAREPPRVARASPPHRYLPCSLPFVQSLHIQV